MSGTEEGEIVPVEEKLVWRLNGMPDVATHILQNPQAAPSDAAFDNYAKAMNVDGGASLTVNQLTQLAKRLAYYTAQAHPEVGGRNQIAILQQAPPTITIDQQTFPEPPRPILHFSLIVNSTFSYSSIALGPGVHEIFVRCHWTGVRVRLDGNFFIANTFVDSLLTYSGGTVNLGNTNQVQNCALGIWPLLRPGHQNVQLLAKAFQWSQVRFDFVGHSGDPSLRVSAPKTQN